MIFALFLFYSTFNHPPALSYLLNGFLQNSIGAQAAESKFLTYADILRFFNKSTEPVGHGSPSSRVLQNAPGAPECFRDSRVLQNPSEAPECSRMLPNALQSLKCSRMLQDAPECFRVSKSAPECSKMLQRL